MKKKIKDLTLEEMEEICVNHTCDAYVRGKSRCPLLFSNSCLQGFIEKMHYIEREVEVDESNNDKH